MLKTRNWWVLTTKRFIYRPTSAVTKEKLAADNDIVWKTIESRNIKTPQDWKLVRNEILTVSGPRGFITPLNIDAMTVGICTVKQQYNLALSYLDFLQVEQVPLNLATIGKYFHLLYVKGNDQLSSDDENRILTLYENLRKTHPVLDSLTLEHIICAFSLTKEWKKCLDMLEEIKITSIPKSPAYSAIIAAAFTNNEEELGWKLLKEMIESNRLVQPLVYEAFFKNVSKMKNNKKTESIEDLFKFMQKFSLKLDKVTGNIFIEHLRALNLSVQQSTITALGICKSCKNKAQNFELTDSEFNELKKRIINNVIVGKDIFNKTTKDELRRFKDFIENMDKFDVVVDGLNVAYSAGAHYPPTVTSGLVSAVVSHFVEEGKKVLVLGRKHMNKWPIQNWGYVCQNATIFLTEDLSQDDPYLLYCALNSGKDTIIISRDLMRGHKFLLNNVHLKHLFDRWLSQRQYQLVGVQQSRRPIFKKPNPFSIIAQKNGPRWHLPFARTPQEKERGFVLPQWLCIDIE